MAKKSYDWVAIKLEFVKSSLSTRDFAQAFDIPYSTLSKKVMNEYWMDERRNFANKTETKSIEKVIDDKAAELAKFEDKSLKAIAYAQNEIIKMLGECEKPNEIKALSSALIDLQKGYRLALGASTENQQIQGVSSFDDWVKERVQAHGLDNEQRS